MDSSIIYTRKVSTRLWLLRSALPLLLVLSYFLFSTRHSDYIVLCGIAFMILVFVRVTEITFGGENITIKIYYLFGLLPFKWSFGLQDLLEVSTKKIYMGGDDHLIEPMPVGLKKYAYYKRYLISVRDTKGKKRTFTENLSFFEYELFFSFYLKQKHQMKEPRIC